MTTTHLFDVVMLKTDLPDSHLAKGETGTVVECYTDGEYEIEFSDDSGETLTTLAVRPDSFEVIWSKDELDSDKTGVARELIAILKTLPADKTHSLLEYASFLQYKSLSRQIGEGSSVVNIGGNVVGRDKHTRDV
ncbi:MAG: DUF4926 domain-containing protein [Chloroflexota bacterium]